MGLELIGIIVSAIAIGTLFYSRAWTLTVLCVALLLQASAAITLHALGGSPVAPGYLMILFLAIAVLIRQNGAGRVLQTLTLDRSEYLLMLFVAWAVVTSIFMPRIFQGMFEVYPLGQDNLLGPLRKQMISPLSSNIAQAVYYVGDLSVFILVGAMLISMRSLRPAAYAVLISAIVNIGLVIVDSVTFATGTDQILDFIRNANYVQRAGDIVLGMKRVTGMFAEASAFSMHALGLFAFTFRLWRGGVSLPFTGLAAAGTFIALVMSTSSTAFAALAIYLMIVMPRDFSGIDRTLPRGRERVARTSLLFSMLPALGVLIAIAIALRPDLLDPVNEMINEMLINKLDSDSGVERMNWNMSAIQNFFDSFGLGVGLGTIQTSSFAISLISSTGFLGLLVYIIFLTKVFSTNGGRRFQTLPAQEDAQIAAAARSGMIALIIANSLSGGASPGLIFYIFAAMAAYKIVEAPVFGTYGEPDPELPDEFGEAKMA
ncbi:MAG: hypothetical protein AAGA89_00310 [Pseudomonadota bacterium]